MLMLFSALAWTLQRHIARQENVAMLKENVKQLISTCAPLIEHLEEKQEPPFRDVNIVIESLKKFAGLDKYPDKCDEEGGFEEIGVVCGQGDGANPEIMSSEVVRFVKLQVKTLVTYIHSQKAEYLRNNPEFAKRLCNLIGAINIE